VSGRAARVAPLDGIAGVQVAAAPGMRDELCQWLTHLVAIGTLWPCSPSSYFACAPPDDRQPSAQPLV